MTQMNADKQKADEEKKDTETYAILGACMEVHTTLGHGFLEAVYQEALAMELTSRGIPFRREVPLPITYKDKVLECTYRCDFFCFDEVVLETKATEGLTGADEAQVINYLKASGLSTGLLVNFGAKSLQYKRFIDTKRRTESPRSIDGIGTTRVQSS
jgi:GxxExxY protein